MKNQKIIIFIIGLVFGLIFYSFYMMIANSFCCVSLKKEYGIPELVYYMSQPLMLLATFGTIIVALFGTEIKNKIFSHKCVTTIITNGFTEDLGDTRSLPNPSVQVYMCTLKLENIGSRELNELQLVIKEVSYAEDNKKLKKISKGINPILFWGNREIKKINLREKESREIILARIYPCAISGTPDGEQKSPLRFSITGHNLAENQSKKGTWAVKYCLQTPNKIIKTFQIKYAWSGLWCNRLSEMCNEVEAIIKDLK